MKIVCINAIPVPSPTLNQYQTKSNDACISTLSKTPYACQTNIEGSMLEKIESIDNTIFKLCVLPTGCGKSILFATLADYLGCITLRITPLLHLGSNQTTKRQRKTALNIDNVNSAHLDKISTGDISKFISDYTTHTDSMSIIMRSSPQALMTKTDYQHISNYFLIT